MKPFLKKDLSDWINYLVFITACLATVFFIVIQEPKLVLDLPQKKIFEYSAAAVIAPLIAVGYLFIILNNQREIPFKIRNVDFRSYKFSIQQKLREGIDEYRCWVKKK